jgi:peptidoglycan/xylan/chitin deacetylase (PgdA/CDA1 family)
MVTAAMSAKTLLRDSAARLLFVAGLTAPERRGRGRLSIVTFHRVLPEAERRGYPFPGLAVTPEELDAFLAYLKAHFDCGALATQHERHLKGAAAQRPLLAVTFDDGQHDNYLHARPVLARHQMLASFFVPVAAIEQEQLLWHDRLGFAVLALLEQAGGRERLLRILTDAGLPGRGARSPAQNAVQASKRLALPARLRLVDALVQASGQAGAPGYARLMRFDELARLAADGHEIGSHSMTHCMMPECDDDALAYEVAQSRRVLQARTGQPIESFCYPNGDADARSAQAVAAAGYRRAVTTAWGSNGTQADRYLLRRFDMDAARVRDAQGRLQPAVLAFRMSGFYPGLHSPYPG